MQRDLQITYATRSHKNSTLFTELASNKITPRIKKEIKNTPNIIQTRHTNEVFFSDEEDSPRLSSKNNKKNTAKPEQSSIDEEDSNFYEMPSKCLPPPSRRRNKTHIRPTKAIPIHKKKNNLVKQEVQQVLNNNRPNLKNNSLLDPTLAHPSEFSSKMESEMVDESIIKINSNLFELQKIEQKKMIAQRLKREEQQRLQNESRRKVQIKMQSLAKIDFNSANNSPFIGPFYTFNQYRAQFESKKKIQYRQFIRQQEQSQHNLIKQKVNFGLLQEAQLANICQNQPEDHQKSYRQFKEANDNIFYKCKDMDNPHLMEYMKSKEYQEQMLKINPIYHMANYERQSHQNKLKRLRINQIVNESFNFNVKRQKSLQHISSHVSYKIPSTIPKIFHYTKAYINKATQRPHVSKQLIENVIEINPPEIKQEQKKIVIHQDQQYDMRFIETDNNVQQIHFKSNEQKNDMDIQLPKDKTTTIISPLPSQNELIPGIVEQTEVKREEMKQTIFRINRMCGLEILASELAEQEKQRKSISAVSLAKQLQEKQLMMPLLAINGKNIAQTANSNNLGTVNPNTFSLGMIQPTIKGVGEIQIIPSKQSLEKTAEPTKTQRNICRVKEEYRQNIKNDGMQAWDNSQRGGPRIKRLQILNRYHFNPFEEAATEDLCQLWKRLMSDEVKDLKSEFKYENLYEMNGINDPEYEKNSLMKVKEQDFHIPNEYDATKKCLKVESQKQCRMRYNQLIEDIKEFQQRERFNRNNEKMHQPEQIANRNDELEAYDANTDQPKYNEPTPSSSFNYNQLYDVLHLSEVDQKGYEINQRESIQDYTLKEMRYEMDHHQIDE